MATIVFGAVSGNWSDNTKWVGGSKPGSGDTAQFASTSGNVTLDANQTVAAVDFTGGGISAYTGTFTHNSSTTLISNGNITFVAGMTYTPNSASSSIIQNGGTCTLTTGGILLGSINASGSSVLTLGDDLNIIASKVCQISIGSASSLNLNGHNIKGNSTTNRILILSGTIGTARTLTVAAGSFANADFQDIQFSSASSLDLSAITGNSGDCGGNSITGGGTTLTFTTSAQQTCTMSTNQNWSSVGIWTSRVPLPQDDVVMTGVTGGTLTADMPRLGRSIDWTGATGSPTWSFSSITNTIFGSVTLISGMTISGSQQMIFAGRSSYSITNAGKTWSQQINITAPSGTYVLNDALSINSGSNFNHTNGTFQTNNFSMSARGFICNGTGTRTLTLGTSTITLLGGTNPWNFTLTGLTFTANTAIIIIGFTTSSTLTFAGAGLSYGTLTYTAAGSTGTLVITGSNTFNTINFSDSANARILQFTAGTTTNIGTFNVNGTAGNLMTVESVTSATHTLNFTGSRVSCNYLDLIYSTATGAPAYAGANSTDGGNNTGWVFTVAPPVASGGRQGGGALQNLSNLQNLRNL